MTRRELLERELVRIDARIRAGEQHVARQRQALAQAREPAEHRRVSALLADLEHAQRALLRARDRLHRALQASRPRLDS